MTIGYSIDGEGLAGSQRTYLAYALRTTRLVLGDSIEVVVLTDHPDVDFGYGTKTVDVSRWAPAFKLDNDWTWRGVPNPAGMFFRLLAPIVPELSSVDEFLYLDADTEIVSAAVADIFSGVDVDAEAGMVAEVKNPNVTRMAINDRGVFSGEDLAPDEAMDRLARIEYYNSGVMAMRLNNLRKDGYLDWLERAAKAASKYHLPCMDQDLINGCFARICRLHPGFNILKTTFNRSLDTPKILHYAGPAKDDIEVYPPPKMRAWLLERGDSIWM